MNEDEEMSVERRQVTDAKKFLSTAIKFFDDGKAVFSNKLSGASQKYLVAQCIEDSKARKVIESLHKAFGQILDKANAENGK
jgi:hypothetical protein